MSYMKRAFDLMQSGVSEAEAMRIVAAERMGEMELCQWSDERCDEPREGGTHFCQAHLPLMRIRYAADSCADDSAGWDDSDASGSREAA